MTSKAISVLLPRPPRELSRGLRRLRRRIRLLLAVRFATLAVAALAPVAVLALVLLKLRGVWYPPLLPEEVLLGALAASALLACSWPLPDALVAASTDRRLLLRDRLLTALHLSHATARTGMEQAAVGDALDHIVRVRPKEAFPLRSTRATRTAGLCLVLMLAAQFAPIPAWLLPPGQRNDRAELRREAARIMPVAKKLEEEAKKQDDKEAQDAARRLQRLAKELERGQLDKKLALLKLDESNKELQKIADRLAPQPPKTAEEAAKQMQQAASRSLASRADDLANQAARRGNKKAEEQYRRMAEQARKSQSPEELKKLAEQLKRMAGKDMARGVPMGTMPELSLALSDRDWDKIQALLESLKDLPEDMTPEELAQLARELSEMAKALQDSDLKELAKELAELAGQCKNCKGGSCNKAKLAGALKAARAKFGKLKLAGKCKGCMGGGGEGYGVGPGDSKGKYDPNAPGAGLYDPRETDTSGKLTRLPSQINPTGKMLTIPTDDPGAPSKVAGSQVPYYEVVKDYSKSAEEALSKEEVPPGYKAQVRQYFKSLQPEAASK